MKKCKNINVRIHNYTNNNYISKVVNEFHVDFIECYLNELSLSNSNKVKIINNVIETLKSKDHLD